MSTKKVLSLEEFLMKLQEAADQVASERDVKTIKVFPLSGAEFGCLGDGAKLCIPILDEARTRVNEKYELKVEE